MFCPNSYGFPTSSSLFSTLLFVNFSENFFYFSTLFLVCVGARACACLCVCVFYLICCLRNTITFLLSDRVSRHTRDRARQCALETGDGARAPKPSASFTDREPFTPLEITRRLAFSHTDTETSCEIRGWIILRAPAVKIGYEARCMDVTRGSLLRFLWLFKRSSTRVRDPGFAPWLLNENRSCQQTTSSADKWYI